jgi:hypothetical protein
LNSFIVLYFNVLQVFVKTSPKGSQYISIPAEKLLEFIMIEKDKVSEENELKEKSN